MITIKDLKKDEELNVLMDALSTQISALQYTDHSERHSSIVSKWTGEILTALGADERTVELGKIAGYLHDIGNAINRNDHAQTGALLSYDYLMRKGMAPAEAIQIVMAIANHDEVHGIPVSQICSALIIADKSDVHKSRVRNKITSYEEMNIHDRVNYSAETSYVEIKDGYICTNITVNSELCSVMDYFEIYHSRMQMCRHAAEFLGYEYTLIINGIKLI